MRSVLSQGGITFFYCRNLFSTSGYLTSKAFVIQGTRSVLAFAEAERVHLAESLGLEPRHRFTDYWPLSKRLPYQLGLRLHNVVRRISLYATTLILLAANSNERLAEREGLEPSRQAS